MRTLPMLSSLTREIFRAHAERGTRPLHPLERRDRRMALMTPPWASDCVKALLAIARSSGSASPSEPPRLLPRTRLARPPFTPVCPLFLQRVPRAYLRPKRKEPPTSHLQRTSMCGHPAQNVRFSEPERPQSPCVRDAYRYAFRRASEQPRNPMTPPVWPRPCGPSFGEVDQTARAPCGATLPRR